MSKSVKVTDKNRDREKPVLITQNEQMQDLCEQAKLVARSQAPVLITGESGSGKEVFANLIHYHSSRKGNPFVAMNCGAVAKDIVESELFGHEKGAFTGAVKQKPGCFEMAHEGTLFLDEIGEMEPELQVKLLRAAELKTFRRVGGDEEIKTDTRIISATNRDIGELMESGKFRKDLFYRLSVIELHIPPLRERKDDIPLLAEYFLTNYIQRHELDPQKFSKECLGKMMGYDWPGNVRELRNVVERCAIMCQDATISLEFLPLEFRDVEPITLGEGKKAVTIPVGTTVENAERMLINTTLHSVDNNKSEAARILGVSRKTLHNKLSKFEQEKAIAT